MLPVVADDKDRNKPSVVSSAFLIYVLELG